MNIVVQKWVTIILFVEKKILPRTKPANSRVRQKSKRLASCQLYYPNTRKLIQFNWLCSEAPIMVEFRSRFLSLPHLYIALYPCDTCMNWLYSYDVQRLTGFRGTNLGSSPCHINKAKVLSNVSSSFSLSYTPLSSCLFLFPAFLSYCK